MGFTLQFTSAQRPPGVQKPPWRIFGSPDPRWEVALGLVHQEGSVTRRQLAAALGVSERTSTRLLRAMVKVGLLYERGHGRAVEYVHRANARYLSSS